jgi:hypothetical protein
MISVLFVGLIWPMYVHTSTGGDVDLSMTNLEEMENGLSEVSWQDSQTSENHSQRGILTFRNRCTYVQAK